MKRRINIFTIIVMLLHLPVFAQDDNIFDQGEEANDTINKGFNALDYLMQDRYQYPDKSFMKKVFLDNFYIQAGAGLFNPNQRGDIKVPAMKEYHVSVGKNITPLHGFRLGAAYGFGNEKETKMPMRNTLFHLDHLFNVSAYIGGYDPMRFFEVSTILGIGYQRSKLGDEVTNSLEGHIGLEARFRAGNQAYLTIEPMIQINNGKVQDSWRYVGLGSGVTVNYQYYLRPLTSLNTNSSRFTKISPFFVEFGLGTQIQNFKNLGVFRSRGASYELSIAKWFSDFFGARLGGDFSYNTYEKKEESYVDKNYMQARFEAMFNPLGLLKNYNPNSFLGFNLSGGIIFGAAHPYGMNRYWYTGYTTSLQGLVRLQQGLQLFVEPRVSFLNADSKSNGGWGKYNETIYDLNVGLRLNYATWAQRKARYEKNSSFSPTYFAQLAGGLANDYMHHSWYGGNGKLDYAGRFSFGYRFTPIHGVRANVDYNRLYDKGTKGQQNYRDFGTVSLDYLFGLYNFMQEGYDADKRLSVDMYAGPVYNFTDKNYGGHVGVILRDRVNKHTSLFISPEFAILSKVDGHPFFGSNKNSLMTVWAGVEYDFKNAKDLMQGLFPSERNLRAGLVSPFFVETAVGASTFKDNLSDGRKNNFGPDSRFAVGHWLNPAVALRLSGDLGYNSLSENTSKHTVLGNLDILFNPFGMGKKYQYDKPFGLNLIGGGSLGANFSNDGRLLVYGYGGGLQLWTRIMRGTRFFIEPRYNHLMFKADKKHTLDQISVMAGMHIDYLPPKSRPAALYGKRPFTDDGLFFQIEGGLVTRKLNHTSGYDTDNSSLNTDWGVALGYQFNALSAVRMAFNLQDCKDKNTGLARSLNISGSYMLNLSNLLLGYDPDDRFSTNLYVGPQGSYQSGLKKWRFGGIAGVQFGYRLNSHMTTYFAPELVSYLPDKNGDHSSRVSYKVGLTYRFNSGNSQLEKLRWFINLGAGVGLAPDAPVGSGNSLGANYRVSLGAWMTDALALRLTGVAAQNRWEQSSTDYFRYHHYYGGRLQLMLDPLTILHSYDKEDAQAGFYLAVGPDLGATYFQSGSVWTHRCTLGLAASVQAWARVGNHTRVFLEPDLSFQKYGAGKGGFYNNKLMSFNLGVSMDITNYPQNTKGKVEKKYNFFAQLGAGTAFDMLNGSHEGSFSLHPSYQITLGYNVDDLSAFRLVVGYNDKKKSVALADHEFDVAYQLNLNNAFTGVDSTRKFDVSMYGGLSFISTPSLSTVAVGSLIGAQANYKLSKGLYLYLSPEARIKHSKYRIMLGIGKYF